MNFMFIFGIAFFIAGAIYVAYKGWKLDFPVDIKEVYTNMFLYRMVTC